MCRYDALKKFYIAKEKKLILQLLQHFLLLEEIEDKEKSSKNLEANDNSNGSINIQKLSASWTEDAIANTLYDINVEIPSKSLFTVVGPVGAGKVTLL